MIVVLLELCIYTTKLKIVNYGREYWDCIKRYGASHAWLQST